MNQSSYIRVIPRDLFNEANLLKCYGRIYLNLETLNLPDVSLFHTGEAFDVRLNDDDGSLTLTNVSLMVSGRECSLHRPLNSREEWPLYLTTEYDEELSVFDDDGSFSAEMRAFLRG